MGWFSFGPELQDHPAGRHPHRGAQPMDPTDDNAIRSALVSHADDFTIVRELHDVPPYRVFEVHLDGRRAVLKMDAHPRGHAAAEGRVQEYVADQTSVPVPGIIAVGRDHFLAEWDDDAPAPGEVEPVDRAWASAVGTWMGTVHAETDGDFDRYGQPRASNERIEFTGHAAWIAVVRDRLDSHRSYLESESLSRAVEAVDVVDDFFRTHPDAFAGAGGPVLCHGNVHPEHAALADGEIVSVVDFEHALVAPGEYDVWRLALPQFEGSDAIDETVSRAFREAYESEYAIPSGFGRRRKLYWLVNFVSYLESLHLQQNVAAEQRGEVAAHQRDLIFDILDDVREAMGETRPDGR